MKPVKIKISNGNLKPINKTNVDSGIATFLQILGWTVIIIGVVVGFINGKSNIDIRSSVSFNALAALSSWITSCTSGAVLVGFGNIIIYLKMIAYNQQEYFIDSPITGELIIEENIPVEIKKNVNQE